MKKSTYKLAFLSLLSTLLFNCSSEKEIAKTLPQLGTTAATAITLTTATSGGNITADGGAAVTTRGIVWNIVTAPTISLATKTTDGSGTGNFSSAIASLTPSTNYYARAYATNSVGTGYGNEITFTTGAVVLPTLTTTVISAITTNSAISGGTITADGGAAITARGVVWSTSQNPTITLTTKTSDGTGIGSYTSNLTNLIQNTTYYIRAYATNRLGTVYGAELNFTTTTSSSTSVTDIDGNTYQLVTICNKTWTKSNLNVSHYRNGDVIPQVTDATQWTNLNTGAWCYYSNTSSNGTTYGKLYNWYAVNDPRGLAPQGYHISTDPEWNSLIVCLDPSYIPTTTIINDYSLTAGGKIKESGTLHWVSPNKGANNSSGFTALPSGSRSNPMNGDFGGGLGYFCRWWSSSEYNSTSALVRYLSTYDSNAYRGDEDKSFGNSVRCVKD